jgi:hypothetical protein
VLAKDKKQNERLVAIKFIYKADCSEYTEREIINHLSIRHPHVVKLYEVWGTSRFQQVGRSVAAQGFHCEYMPSTADPSIPYC